MLGEDGVVSLFGYNPTLGEGGLSLDEFRMNGFLAMNILLGVGGSHLTQGSNVIILFGLLLLLVILL